MNAKIGTSIVLGGAALLVLAGCGNTTGSAAAPAPTSAVPASAPTSATSSTPFSSVSAPSSSASASATAARSSSPLSPSSPASVSRSQSAGSAPTTAGAGAAPATEFNPPGDIPDTQVFVDFTVPGGGVTIKVPEGWARSTASSGTSFSDHFNSIQIAVKAAGAAPTVQSVRGTEIPALARMSSHLQPKDVTSVQRAGGTAVLATYLVDSAPDAVTGKVVRDAVERYEFWKSGRVAVLTLAGPQNADNVDPWKLVSNSLQWK